MFITGTTMFVLSGKLINGNVKILEFSQDNDKRLVMVYDEYQRK